MSNSICTCGGRILSYRDEPPESAERSQAAAEPSMSRTGACLYQADCTVPVDGCRNGPVLRDSNYWQDLNSRLNCDEQTFNRWRTIYDMTTCYTGQQILQQRADCRRKPFYPRRCELCNIVDDFRVRESLCKQYFKPKLHPLECYGDYSDPCPPQHPPPMLTSDRCFSNLPPEKYSSIR